MCKMVRRFSESGVVEHTPKPETYRSISSPEELNCTEVCVKVRSEQEVLKNSSKRKKCVIDAEQNYDINVHERHKDDLLNSLMLGYIGLNTKILESVSTFLCIVYQLILEKINAKKDTDSKNCCYGGKVKQEENSTIFNKSKAIFGSLDYLFGLQGFPTQIIHHFPAISLTTYFDSLSSGLSLPLDQSMSNNLLRIASFSNFPRHVNIFTSLLSKAGFYYTGNDDEVRCYACGITHKKWTSTDDPIKIHQELSPSCQHLISLTNDNLSIAHESPPQSEKSSLVGNSNNPTNSSTLSIQTTNSTLNSNTVSRENTLTFAQGQSFSSVLTNESCNGASLRQLDQNTTACQSGQFAPKKGYTPQTPLTNTESTCQHIASNENATNTQLRNETTSHVINSSQIGATGNDNPSHSQQSNGIDLPSMGIHLDKPRYPNYAPLQMRVSSYQGWPSYLDQTPRQMATAGFLFAGYQDYTRCFFCGGGLRNWEAGDDPWIEHARWFPKCTYLLQNKGPKFVKAVQDKQEQLEREQSQGASNNVPSPLQYAEPSNSNSTDNHKSNSQLDTVAAKSVLEMGYSSDEVLQAIQLCNSSNPGTSISATDIMSVILNIEDEGNTAAASTIESTSGSVNTAGVTSTNIHSVVGNSDNITLEGSIHDDTELLLEENKQLRDQRLCKICLEFDACIAFLPCGHLVCCSDCAPAMRKCPICRAYVKGTVKTFLA